MKHICVCICTYRRPLLLRRLLESLHDQKTGGLFSYSIVVVDNDNKRSGVAAVSEFAASAAVPVRYCVEPQQNIALARNKAVENATGDFVAFVDDDEFATDSWLLMLFKACHEYRADGALGPVKPHFDKGAPRWVVRSGLFDRRSYPTGLVIDWTMGRTGNTLLRRRVFPLGEAPFRPEFRTGEDQDFFRRVIEKGHKFVWCDEAVAYEVVPPVRWKRNVMVRKALLRGSLTLLHPNFGVREVAKSAIAVPAYVALLPLALLLGQHCFMHLVIKICDHLGKLLACLGIKPIKVAYVTE